MRKAILLSTFLLSFSLFAENKPDLTGNWVLNIDKSKLGKMPKMQAMTLTATKKGEVYHSVSTTDDGQGKKSVEGDWFMDGKEHPVEPGATGSKMTQMSKWDGKTIVASRKSDDGAYKEDVKMSFSGDGKTATQHLTVKSPNGNNTATLIWERK